MQKSHVTKPDESFCVKYNPIDGEQRNAWNELSQGCSLITDFVNQISEEKSSVSRRKKWPRRWLAGMFGTSCSTQTFPAWLQGANRHGIAGNPSWSFCSPASVWLNLSTKISAGSTFHDAKLPTISFSKNFFILPCDGAPQVIADDADDSGKTCFRFNRLHDKNRKIIQLQSTSLMVKSRSQRRTVTAPHTANAELSAVLCSEKDLFERQ